MRNVTIYSTPVCGFCNLAKQYFKDNNIKYSEKNVATDVQAREEMVAKTGQMGVPVIDIDGETVIGFDQARLAEILNIN